VPLQSGQTEGVEVKRKNMKHVLALAPAAAFAAATAPKRKAEDMPGLAIRNDAGLGRELLIYGTIGGGFWSDGITASGVAELLAEVGTGPLHVRINSGGGDVFQGTAIYSLLAQHPGKVTGTIDGLAASAATVIMLACDTLRVPKHAFGMIHDAMTMTYGNGDTHRDAGELLDKVYADKAGEDPEFWRAKMTVNGEDGTWYTGQEMVDAGLADEILELAKEDDEVAAHLSGWVNLLPSSIVSTLTLPPEPVEDDPAPEQLPAPEATNLGRDLAFAMLASNVK
jgi:ATP-dependent protease ClpP protease subunit